MSGEHQWIQIDPERCKTDHVFALKKTVAHGFYTISTYGGNIVAAFPKSTIFLTEIVNVKFVRPIYVDDPVYNTCKLLSVEDISKDHFRLKIEGQTYHKETNKRCIKITCIGYMHKHLEG